MGIDNYGKIWYTDYKKRYFLSKVGFYCRKSALQKKKALRKGEPVANANMCLE